MTGTAAPKSFPVSWEELHRTSKALAWRLLENGPFKGIVAVTRGGLVPAAIVARELEIRLIETACIASYDNRDQGSLQVVKAAPEAGDGEGWLIVDDLVDTGETAKALRAMLPYAHRHHLRQASRAAAGGYVRHRGQSGHLDLFPLGSGTPADNTDCRAKIETLITPTSAFGPYCPAPQAAGATGIHSQRNCCG